MCEHAQVLSASWKGWQNLPAPDAQAGKGPWMELSHPLVDHFTRSPAFPQPAFRRLLSLPEASCNLTEMQMVCHYGTHVDAPLHFIADGPAMQDIPLDRFYGPGVIWHLDKPSLGLIDASDFERARPAPRPGDIVVLDTGWGDKIFEHDYHTHPYLTPEAAQWLVDHQIKMLVVDFSTPDLPKAKRPTDRKYEFPVHAILLSAGVLVAEHAAPPHALRNRRVDIMFAPLNIVDSDGAPVRGLVREMVEG
jgi:arylformamidase